MDPGGDLPDGACLRGAVAREPGGSLQAARPAATHRLAHYRASPARNLAPSGASLPRFGCHPPRCSRKPAASATPWKRRRTARAGRVREISTPPEFRYRQQPRSARSVVARYPDPLRVRSRSIKAADVLYFECPQFTARRAGSQLRVSPAGRYRRLAGTGGSLRNHRSQAAGASCKREAHGAAQGRDRALSLRVCASECRRLFAAEIVGRHQPSGIVATDSRKPRAVRIRSIRGSRRNNGAIGPCATLADDIRARRRACARVERRRFRAAPAAAILPLFPARRRSGRPRQGAASQSDPHPRALCGRIGHSPQMGVQLLAQ